MAISIEGQRFEDEYAAADWIMENGTPTGEYGLRRVHLDGVPIGDVMTDYLDYDGQYRVDGVLYTVNWVFPIECEELEFEDWPWDNGTAKVVVDGFHVERVA